MIKSKSFKLIVYSLVGREAEFKSKFHSFSGPRLSLVDYSPTFHITLCCYFTCLTSSSDHLLPDGGRNPVSVIINVFGFPNMTVVF